MICKSLLLQCLWKVNQGRYQCLSQLLSSQELNSTMKKLISMGKYQEALDFSDQQLSMCTDVTFTLALKACTKLNAHQHGIRIHQRLSSKALKDPYLQTSLIHFYMQCHQIDHANQIFSTIEKTNLFAYGAMFTGYMSNEKPEKVLELFEKSSIEVNEVIVTILFNACAKLITDDAIKFGKDLLNRIPTSFLDDEKLVTSAIDMFMKSGSIEDAERLFHQTKKRTIVTYGAMMQGYLKHHLFDRALSFFEKIPLQANEIIYSMLYQACASLSNQRAIQFAKKTFDQMPKIFLHHVSLVNSAIHMFMRFGQVDDAHCLYKQMSKPDLYTYGMMINGYKVNQQPKQCLTFFKEVKEKIGKINEATALALIGACSQIGIHSISEDILQHISHLQNNLQIQNSLIDMWGKSSAIHRAEEIFQSIAQPDIFTYNSMINAYGRNGMGYDAIDLYERMPENIRTPVSHICVLNACSHSGLMDQALTIFNKVIDQTEKIITTMVDCLSRMGIFDQAQELVKNYERSNSPSFVMYMAMLSGARNHRQAVLSEKLYDRMKCLFPEEKIRLIAASILVSNTYSSLGNDQKAEAVRLNRIKQFGKNVKVGVSWTEVNGELLEFKAHDRSHPRSDEIYAELDRLSIELKEHGHQYDSSWVTRPLKDGESIESVLCGHSEKLAIAFNLIQRPSPSFIQITKNLRVCGDCHHATKLIAKIRQCHITVRDENRIHHFSPNGQCSCQDHF